MKHLLLLIAIVTCTTLNAQTAHKALRRGDKAYQDQNYEKARQEYDAALEAENSAKGNYNAGNALFEQGDFEEAAQRYEEAASLTDDNDIRSRAYRNLADAQFQQQQYEDAVESYKQSLRINPDDKSTKYNLSKAIQQLQQQQQQQQQGEGEGEQDPNQQQQGQGQPQDGQGGEQGDQQQQGDQQESEGEQEGEANKDQGQATTEGESAAKPQNPKMSREEAERQLEIAAEAEKETMRRLQNGDRQGCKTGKDW